MDPDFRMPSYKMYDMNLPVTTGPSSVSSLSGGGGNMFWAPVIAGGLQALGGMFEGRRASREAERNRELERQRIALQNRQFGLQRQQYQDQLARMRAQAEFTNPLRERFTARGGIGDIGKFDLSQYASKATPETRQAARQDLQSLLAGIRQRDMEQG